MTDLVWYASYGSNLRRARFDTYIRGGTPDGAATGQVGCTDPSPPRAVAPIRIHHRLYFAGRFPKWRRGGVAFIRPERDPAVATLGRMYLVTREQFREVVYQENGHDDFAVDLGIDLDEATRRGVSTFEGGAYSTLLGLGSHGGFPILTFTTARTPEELPPNPPAPEYLRTIVRGLRETYAIDDDAITAYLRSAPGIAGSRLEATLQDLVAETL